MAEVFMAAPLKSKAWEADLLEKILSAAAIALLCAVGIALIRGWGEWNTIPANVWAHIATILVALALTPVMLLRQRGTPGHRQLGWIWAIAMFLTALVSFDVRLINQGSFSFIHILSAWTMIQVPVIVWSARTKNVKRHRGSVRGMIIGALLLAGLFTFPFGRLMGNWLFG
jgi:uncharacterized membrane protein